MCMFRKVVHNGSTKVHSCSCNIILCFDIDVLGSRYCQLVLRSK